MSLMLRLFAVPRSSTKPRARSWKFSAVPTASVQQATPGACAMTCYWPTKREAVAERESLIAQGYNCGDLQPSSQRA